MSEKPQKRLVVHSNAGRNRTPPPPTRLVTKGKYVLLMGKSLSLTFLGMSSYLIGSLILIGLVVELSATYLDLPYWANVLSVLAASGLSTLFFLTGWRLATKAYEIEHVEPITVQNTHLLPAEESLVRASDAPPSQEQTQLLRAAQSGKETVAEELLRASTTDGRF